MKTRTYYHFTFQALMEVTTLIIFYQNHQPFKKIKIMNIWSTLFLWPQAPLQLSIVLPEPVFI